MADVVIMPKLGFDMAEGTLIRWEKQEGEAVEKGELLAEIETDKATVEVESNFGGTVRKLLVTEGAIVPVNTPIAIVGGADEDIDVDALVGSAGAEETAPASEPTPTVAPDAPPVAASLPSSADGNVPGGVKASPLARKIAEDQNVNLQAVNGSGPGGRITKADVEAYMQSPAPAGATSSAPGFSLPPVGAAVGQPHPDTRVPLTRLRQAIGRRMTQSKQQVPHFYVTHEFDMEPVMQLREQANTMLSGGGEKLSVNDFIIKATALALREFPNLNARLDNDAVIQFGHVNIGVAVSVEGGLLTVVTHDADQTSLRHISLDVKAKAGRAREGKVQPADVDGSTFSISNLGMYDVENFFAIINPPEAAILAVGSALQVPVVKDGEIVPGWRMKATLSVDHRVSDGAEGAQFMQALARYLENPVSMLL